MPLVHQLVEEQARRHPDRVAVESESEAATYRQLNGRANLLAKILVARGIDKNIPVGVCVDRGVGSIVALLAVLKAGGTCVPLDPQYPPERQAMMALAGDVRLVLTQARMTATFELNGMSVMQIDDRRLAAAGEVDEVDIPARAGSDDLAYVLFTSGSTGAPKGVEIEHHAVADNAARTAVLLALDEHDRMLQFASASFVSSLGQIFGPLVCGSRLVLRTKQYSARQILDYAAEKQVSVLWLTPSVITYLINRPGFSIESALPRLRLLRSGGEALNLDLVRRWFAQCSVPLMNIYGPTEAVQDITAHQYTSVPDVVTIGRPLFDANVFVMDESSKVPVGEEGELWLSSPGMARGYLNDPELTADRFVYRSVDGLERRLYRSGDIVRQRADGTFEYRGRRDNQVKINGFRVELDEIEARLRAHDAVREAAVLQTAKPDGTAGLTAYYVLDEHTSDRNPDLLRWCAQVLPMHVVPGRYIEVDGLPLTANGKLDRHALVALGSVS